MSVNDFFMCPIWVGESTVYTGTPPVPPTPTVEGDVWIKKGNVVLRKRMSQRKLQLIAEFLKAELYE